MANNSDNFEWNALHGGSRVPVNDTGLSGAPFALFSTSSWEDGCINKAVVSTWTFNGGIFAAENQDDADDLKLDFVGLSPYIFKDMLYGYNGEAYNQEPISTIDYRGYPTPLQQTLTSSILYKFSSQAYLVNGNIELTERSVIIDLNLVLTYQLPYAVYGLLSFTNVNTAETITYETKIDAGSVIITHYREPQLDPELDANVWIGILSSEMYLSVSTEGLSDPNLTIDVAYSHTTAPINEGSIINQTIPLTLAEYSTDPTPGATHLGEARRILGLTSPSCFIDTCNEIDRTTILGSSTAQLLFMNSADTLQTGAQLYADDLLTVSPGAGKYWWLTFAYTLDGTDVFTVTKAITLDSNDLIIAINQAPSGWMGANCWIDSPCN